MFGYSHEFTLLILENKVVVVCAFRWLVGWHCRYFQSIYLSEFFCRSKSSTGHARKLLVHSEIILESNRTIGARFLFNFDALLGLNGLMETFRPAAAGLEAASKSIYDHNFTILYYIITFFEKQRFSPHGRLKMMHVLNTFFCIDILNSQNFLCFFYTLIG